jgi:hypothetical protein
MVHARPLIDRLAAQEAAFLGREFLAPVVGSGSVCVRMAGVVCRMGIDAGEFRGWGVFRPVSYDAARFVREAGLRERRGYLDPLPQVRMILSQRSDKGWQALPAQRGDRRVQVQVQGEVPVQFVEGGEPFTVVRTRFDGRNFWFDGAETRHDPAAAVFLRESLERLVPPENLRRPGLTPEEKAAYTLRYFERVEVRERLLRDEVEERLRAALAHAGAEFVGYAEHRDGYRVTYRVGRQRHVSSVRKEDLSVQVAGICLSGQDARFDLHSLVGVLLEAGGEILRIGREAGGLDEQDYWRIHPPR